MLRRRKQTLVRNQLQADIVYKPEKTAKLTYFYPFTKIFPQSNSSESLNCSAASVVQQADKVMADFFVFGTGQPGVTGAAVSP